MLDITTLNFELKYLSEEFYTSVAPTLKEVLDKTSRPYCFLLVKVKNLPFAIPLRSNLPEKDGIGIKTIENKKNAGRFKGMDFSKAVLITDKKYVKDDVVQLKEKSELLFIKSSDKKILREFKKYIEGYITAQLNKVDLDDKYKFTTLQNYHKELGLEK